MTTTDPPLRDGDDTPAPPRGVRASLLALGSAAVLAVYAAGYVRTREAAAQIENAGSRRRLPVPDPIVAHQDTIPAAAPVVQSASVAKPRPVPETVAKGTAVQPAPPADPVVVAAAASAPVSAAPVPAPVPAAPVPAPVAPVIAKPDSAVAATGSLLPGLKDGRYRGWGYSQHGNIEAEVEIQAGRIVTASVMTCLMAWPCDSYIRKLPPQVVERQSPDVDTVTGATQSADAFYWGLVNALKKAT